MRGLRNEYEGQENTYVPAKIVAIDAIQRVRAMIDARSFHYFSCGCLPVSIFGDCYGHHLPSVECCQSFPPFLG